MQVSGVNVAIRNQLLALQVGRPAVGGVLEHVERLLAHCRARIPTHWSCGGRIVETDAGPVRVDHHDAGRLRGGRCRSGEQSEGCRGESTCHDAAAFPSCVTTVPPLATLARTKTRLEASAFRSAPPFASITSAAVASWLPGRCRRLPGRRFAEAPLGLVTDRALRISLQAGAHGGEPVRRGSPREDLLFVRCQRRHADVRGRRSGGRCVDLRCGAHGRQGLGGRDCVAPPAHTVATAPITNNALFMMILPQQTWIHDLSGRADQVGDVRIAQTGTVCKCRARPLPEQLRCGCGASR